MTIKDKIAGLFSCLSALFRGSSSCAKEELKGYRFKRDGSKFYSVSIKKLEILEFFLPIAYDSSSAKFRAALDVSKQTKTPKDVFLSTDETKLWLSERASKKVFEYVFSTSCELSSATFLRVHPDRVHPDNGN